MNERYIHIGPAESWFCLCEGRPPELHKRLHGSGDIRCETCNMTAPFVEERPCTQIERDFIYTGVFWNGQIRFTSPQQTSPLFLAPRDWEQIGSPVGITVRIEPKPKG